MVDFDEIKEQLKCDEGFSSKPYRCSAGKLTIGHGRNLDDVGITAEEADYLLNNDIVDCYSTLDRNFTWFTGLSEQLQGVLINMCFNLGFSRLLTFRKMLAAFSASDFTAAAKEMKNSDWYRQVGPRADRLIHVVGCL
jgi:lysozyme